MPQTPHEVAARQAASRLYEIILAMLANGQSGEAAIVIDGGFLQPEKRVRQKGKAIRVAVGEFAEIETR